MPERVITITDRGERMDLIVPTQGEVQEQLRRDAEQEGQQTVWPYAYPCGCNLETGACQRHADMLGRLATAYREGKITEAAWKLADGYGTPGTGDRDWSAIRDSSPSTIEKIAALVAARPVTSADDLCARLVGYKDAYEAVLESRDQSEPIDGWDGWTINAIGHDAFYAVCLRGWYDFQFALLTDSDRERIRSRYVAGAREGAKAAHDDLVATMRAELDQERKETPNV